MSSPPSWSGTNSPISSCASAEPANRSGEPARAAGSPAIIMARSIPESSTTVSHPVPVTAGLSTSGFSPAARSASDGRGTTTSRCAAPAGAENARTESLGVPKSTSVKDTSTAGALASCTLHVWTRSGVRVSPSRARTTRSTSVPSVVGVTIS